VNHILHEIKSGLFRFLAFAFIFLVGQYIVWQVYPYRTADVQEPIVVTNLNNEVAPGGTLGLYIEFDKFTDLTPDVSRNLICLSGNVYSVTPAQERASLPQGDGQTANSFYTVDTTAQDGDMCVFEFKNDYRVNPVRTITNKWRSEVITIKE